MGPFSIYPATVASILSCFLSIFSESALKLGILDARYSLTMISANLVVISSSDLSSSYTFFISCFLMNSSSPLSRGLFLIS